MRPNQQNNKNRSRNRNGGRKHVNPLSRNYESNGPDVKVRGNAAHVAEKYTQLARDAQSSGDSVMAENYLQHAEHYYRIVMAAQPQNMRQDGSQDSEDEYETEDHDQSNRFASRAPRPQRERDEEREREEVREAQPVEAASEDAPSAPEGDESKSADAAPAEGEGRRRERRPRRRRQPFAGEGADPANAPQPDMTDLPAFITSGGAAAAE